MRIDVWADLRGPSTQQLVADLDEALSAFPQAQDVAVLWHSFEIDRTEGPSNTYDAHRVLHLARQNHCHADVLAVLATAAADGVELGRRELLVALAVEGGLAEHAVRAMLDSEDCGYEVRIDEATAKMAGVAVDPTVVFGQKYAATGLQPVAALITGIEQAWAERNVAPTERGGLCGDGACGGGGCGGACSA